jgi:hypothetical protein
VDHVQSYESDPPREHNSAHDEQLEQRHLAAQHTGICFMQMQLARMKEEQKSISSFPRHLSESSHVDSVEKPQAMPPSPHHHYYSTAAVRSFSDMEEYLLDKCHYLQQQQRNTAMLLAQISSQRERIDWGLALRMEFDCPLSGRVPLTVPESNSARSYRIP